MVLSFAKPHGYQFKFSRRLSGCLKIISALAATLAFACCQPVHAAPANLPLTFDALESLGSDSQAILALMQDHQGFIWIGTIEGGLYRYDGRSAVKYVNDPANPASLPGGRV